MEKKEVIEEALKLDLEGHVVESRYFFFETDSKSRNELAIVFGGFEKCATDFEIKRRTYPYYVLEIPLKGSCELIIKKEPYKLTKGTVGGFCPGVAHHYKCSATEPREKIFIVFTGLEAKELFKQSGLNHCGVINLSKICTTGKCMDYFQIKRGEFTSHRRTHIKRVHITSGNVQVSIQLVTSNL